MSLVCNVPALGGGPASVGRGLDDSSSAADPLMVCLDVIGLQGCKGCKLTELWTLVSPAGGYIQYSKTLKKLSAKAK